MAHNIVYDSFIDKNEDGIIFLIIEKGPSDFKQTPDGQSTKSYVQVCYGENLDEIKEKYRNINHGTLKYRNGKEVIIDKYLDKLASLRISKGKFYTSFGLFEDDKVKFDPKDLEFIMREVVMPINDERKLYTNDGKEEVKIRFANLLTELFDGAEAEIIDIYVSRFIGVLKKNDKIKKK